MAQVFNSLEEFEKSLQSNEYKYEEINLGDYPNLSQEDLLHMREEAEERISRWKVPFAFTYLKKLEDGTPYIDIFIWDKWCPTKYHRFVLREGYSLGPEETKRFLAYAYQWLDYSEDNLKETLIKVVECMPHIHMVYYLDDIQTALCHLFYSLTKCNLLKELLYKANLTKLAKYAHDLSDTNILGTNLEDILGVQLGMLDALDSYDGVKLLKNCDERENARQVYAKFHNLIHGTKLTEYSFYYLKECMEKRVQPQKKLFRFLNKIECKEDYENYERYLKHRQKLKDEFGTLFLKYEPFFKEIPKADELNELEERLNMLLFFMERLQWINSHFEKAAKRYKRYIYEDEKYSIIVPGSIDEFFEEAIQQSNCLWKYIWKHIKTEDAILFMRRKDAPEKSLVTLEIKNGFLMQARQRFNRPVTEEQLKFICDFAKHKELIIGF